MLLTARLSSKILIITTEGRQADGDRQTDREGLREGGGGGGERDRQTEIETDRHSVREIFSSFSHVAQRSNKMQSVSQGRICPGNSTCCHTEIQDADHTRYLSQSHYANTGQARRVVQ